VESENGDKSNSQLFSILNATPKSMQCTTDFALRNLEFMLKYFIALLF
jgi:hypothetical protein